MRFFGKKQKIETEFLGKKKMVNGFQIREVNMNAVYEMTDQQDLIAFVKKHGKYRDACEEAIKKITDQDILTDFAQNGRYSWIRAIAATRINSRSVLEDIAKKDPDEYVRINAFNRLLEI